MQKKNNRKKELDEYSKKYGAFNYTGLRYSDIEKSINDIQQKSNAQNTQSKITTLSPSVNVNLGSVTINDEKKIKEISSQVGRDTDEALAAALMTQFITQK